MNRPKYETCIHSTGNIGELIVYVEAELPTADKNSGQSGEQQDQVSGV